MSEALPNQAQKWFTAFRFAAADEGSGGADGDGAAATQGDKETGGEASPAKTVLGGEKPGDGETPESSAAKGGEKEGEKAATEGVDDGPPEDGKYTFDLPEGFEPDERLIEALSPVLKELGLSQAKANKLVEAYASVMQAQAAEQAETFDRVTKEWEAQARADKGIAALGGFDEAVRHANVALERLDPEGELSKAIGTGFINGSHPALIRFVAKAGKAIANDTTETATGAGGGETPTEDRWYGQK